MKKVISILLIATTMTFFTLGCARQPSEKRTTGIMKQYFKKYSKKYPDSLLGRAPVDEIKILHIEEIHKDLIAAFALLGLKNGMIIQTRFSVQKKPLGWRAVSWENMGLATANKEN